MPADESERSKQWWEIDRHVPGRAFLECNHWTLMETAPEYRAYIEDQRQVLAQERAQQAETEAQLAVGGDA